MRTIVLAAAIAATATGCMNLATKPTEITGSYTSDIKYAPLDCNALAVEVNSLARREDQLVIAQEQRRKSSKVQAFWVGYGNGDGIEASELANVRGEKEAVRRAMDKKACHVSGGQTAAVTAPVVDTAAVSTTQAPAAGRNDWRSWGSQSAQPASKTLYKCRRADGTDVVSDTPAVGCVVLQN